MEEKYQLADALSIYDDLNGSLVVLQGKTGKICRMSNSSNLIHILDYLQRPSTFKGVVASFPYLTEKSLHQALSRLISLGVVEKLNEQVRQIRCMLIGCGSIGSHVFKQLSMFPLKKMLLVDNDIVDETNIYRQDFYPEDIGLKKTVALLNRSSCIEETVFSNQRIMGPHDLVELIQAESINLVIQAADCPTTDDMARIVNKAGDYCNVPYIVNPGYIGNAMSLPEFFYPNLDYSYASSHLSIPGEPVLRFQKNKLSYRFCDELACLIAQQVDDYRHHKIPRYYGEKGYFNTIDFKWCTKRMSSFDDNKVKD